MTRIETAIIMVTDLVGSTELASRVGNVTYEALRHEHDSILGDDIEDSGGLVIKNTGDGVLAVFPSVTAALAAATTIQQHLERRTRTADVATLRVRIGISIGDALVDDGDYFGIPPIEATRLCARAEGGEILISDPVLAVLRDRKGHRFDSRGPLELKGMAEPVTAWILHWQPLPEATDAALPPRLRGLTHTTYVGRAAEQSRLLESWDRTVDAQRQVVVISGEPGIGKTRLVAEAAATAIPDDALILYGRCDEDQGVPYHPWLEILREYVRVAPRRLLRPYAGELVRLVPELTQKLGTPPPPPSTDPDAERYQLFNAVAGLLTGATARAPLLVILDDLHWADQPTLQLFRHLVTTTTAGRLMLLGTFRDSDVGAEDPLTAMLADLRRESGVTRIDLVGLAAPEIIDLMEVTAGHPIDASGLDLAGEVHRETAGNPFFVGEILRHLRETGTIALDADGQWSFDAPRVAHSLPQSVREVVGRRLQRLGAAARGVLSTGAVIGPEFDIRLIARVAGLPASDLLDLLDEAVDAALLTRTSAGPTSAPASPSGIVTATTSAAAGQMYAFSHGLVQATLYDALPTGTRLELHRSVGIAIEELYGDPPDRLGELAHHFLEATLGGDADRAVDYATRAGQQAMRQFAYDRAEVLFARALGAIPAARPADQIPLLQFLGEARMRRGDTTAARRTLLAAAAAARRHDEPEALARATLACGIWGLSAGVDEELVALAEEAIAGLADRPSRRLLAELKGLLAVALYYAPAPRRERCRQLASEAVVLARSEHERLKTRESAASLAYVLVRALLADWGIDSAAGDVECAEALDLCRQVGNRELELLVRNWRVNVLFELGDFAGLDAEVAKVEHMATELRQPRAIVYLPLHRGMRAAVQGRFTEAEQRNAESRRLGAQVGNPLTELAGHAQVLLIRLLQGRLPELEQPLRGLVDAYPSLVALRCALVTLLVQAGRQAEARDELTAVMAGGRDGIATDNTFGVAVGLLAEAATQLKDANAARALYEWLTPLHGRWVVSPTAAALWPVDRSLGILAGTAGDAVAGLAHLATAKQLGERADALPTLALTALDEARLRAARRAPGDREQVRVRAREARVLGAHLDMRQVVSEAARLEAGATSAIGATS